MNQIISIALNANPGNLIKGMAQAETATAKFGSALEGTQNIIRATSQAIDAASSKFHAAGQKIVAAGVGIGVSLGGATYKAMQFQAAMANVGTILDPAQGSLRRMSAEVLKLSQSLPQSATELSQGLYDVVSSGFQGAEAMKVLTASATAASAGLSTTATSGKAIVAVLNAYGLGAAAANDVSDILFQTVNKGVLSFEELASSVGDWVGMAAAAGVAADQAGSAIAAMTLAGINSDEAATALARLMQAFINPSAALAALAHQFGYESAKTMLDVEGLGGAMNHLRIATGGNIETLVKLFPEIRAARGAMALMANDGKNFASTLDAIANRQVRANATTRAFHEQAKAASISFALFRNSLSAVAIEIGSAFLPVVSGILKVGTDVLRFFANLPAPVHTALAAFGALGGILLAVGGWFLMARARTYVISLAFMAMSKVVGLAVGLMSSGLQRLGVNLAANAAEMAAQKVAMIGNIATQGKLSLAYKGLGAAARFFGMSLNIVNTALPLIGFAFVAVSTAMVLFDHHNTEVKKHIEDMTSALEEQHGVLGNVEQDWATNAFKGKNQLDDLYKMGIYIGDVIKMTKEGSKGFVDFFEQAQRSGQITILGDHAGDINTFIQSSGKAAAYAQATANGWVKGNTGVIKTFQELQKEEQGATSATLQYYTAQGAISKAQLDFVTKLHTSKDGVTNYTKVLDDLQPIIAAWLNKTGQAKDAMADGVITTDEITQAEQDQTAAEQARAQAVQQAASAIENSIDPMKTYTSILDDMKTAEEEHAKKLADSTKSSEDTWQQYVDKVTVNLDELANVLEYKMAAQVNFQMNLLKLAAAGYGDVAQSFKEQGSEVAGDLVQSLIDHGPDSPEFKRVMEDFRASLPTAAGKMAEDTDRALQMIDIIVAAHGKIWADGIASQMGLSIDQVRWYAAQFNIQLPAGNAPVVGSGGHHFLPEENGNILAFANGKENHIAQIAPAGAMRLWAEPETGGEAYIPLSPQKRGRSRNIWRQTGHLLGMYADGGMAGLAQQVAAGWVGHWAGMTQPGNIDLAHRPLVKNPDGSTSTVDSFSFTDDRTNREILVPKVVDSPRPHLGTNQEAADYWYYNQWKLLGAFKGGDYKDSDSYAEYLHRRQASFYHLADGGIIGGGSASAGSFGSKTKHRTVLRFAPGGITYTSDGGHTATTSAHDAAVGAMYGGLGSNPTGDAKKAADDAQRLGEEIAKNVNDAFIKNLGLTQALVDEFNKEIAAEQPYTDKWVGLVQQRDQALADLESHNVEIQANRFKLGKISSDQYIGVLYAELAKAEIYSDKWMQIRDDINAAQDAKSKDFISSVKNEYETTGDNAKQYLDVLTYQLAGFKKYSDDWTSTEQELQRVKDEAAKQDQDLQDKQHELGQINNTRYLKILQDRLAATKKYSDAYMALERQIQQIEADIAAPAQQAKQAVIGQLSQAYEAAKQAFDQQQKDYEAAIKAARDNVSSELENVYSSALSKWHTMTDDYATAVDDRNKKITQALNDFKDSVRKPIEDLGNLVQTFGQNNNTAVSADEITAMFNHRIDAAQRWSDTMKQLSAKGFQDDLIKSLSASGPQSLNLAQTLLTMDPNQINSQLENLKSIGGSLADVLGLQQQSSITAQVTADNPLPAMKEFNEVLQDELDLYVKGRPERDAAQKWAESMADQYMPKVTFQWKTFDDLLQGELSNASATAAAHNEAEQWAINMYSGYTNLTGALRDYVAQLIAAATAAQNLQNLASTKAPTDIPNVSIIPNPSIDFGNLPMIGGVPIFKDPITGGNIKVPSLPPGKFGNVPIHLYDQGGYLPPGLSMAYNGTGAPERVGNAPIHVAVDARGSSLSAHEIEAASRKGVEAALSGVGSAVRQGVKGR